MHIGRTPARALRRGLLGITLPFAMAAALVGAVPAQAAVTGIGVAEANPGDPALPEYPGLPGQPPPEVEPFRVNTTPKPCGDNGTDKSLTRADVITRARTWLSVDVQYSQERCYRNDYGDYRTDCSGFVSMAWGLGGAGHSFWTGNLLDRSFRIDRGDLQPGDALWRNTGNPSENHVALFLRWADAGHDEPIVIEQTGSRDTVQDTWSKSYAAKYTPIRYDHIKTPPAPAPAPEPRIGVLTTADVALVKQGTLGAAWVAEHAGVRQVVVAGDRVGVLTDDGVAKVKDGTLGATWTTVYTGVQQLALSGDRIGVLSNGEALVKEGNLNAVWRSQYTAVTQLALAGDRIGVLTGDGVARVKDGSLGARWKVQHSGVTQLALTEDRIGVLTDDGLAKVKDGGLSALWKNEYSGVRQLVLAGDRIGVVTGAGDALVKDGALAALWKNEYSGVRQLALAGDRIGVLTTAGVALVKAGSLSAGWRNEYSGVEQIALS